MSEFEMGKQLAQGNPESLSDATGFSSGEVAQPAEELRQVGVVDPCPFCSLTNSAPAQEPVQRRGHQDYEPTPGGAAQGRVPSPGGGEGKAGLGETGSEFGRVLHGLEDSMVNSVLAAAWETIRRTRGISHWGTPMTLEILRAAVDTLTAEAYRHGLQDGARETSEWLRRLARKHRYGTGRLFWGW